MENFKAEICAMSVYETLSLMIAFGLLIATIVKGQKK